MNKKDLFRTLWFIAIFFLISYAMSRIYMNNIMKDSILMRVDKQFQETQEHIKYFILGDSHSQYGLNPDVVGGGFNFSTANGSYIHSYFQLKYALEEGNKKIDYVILPFDLHTFSSFNRTDLNNSWYWQRYFDYKELSKLEKKRALVAIELLKNNLMPFIGKREVLLKFIENDNGKRNIIHGFIPTESDFLNEDELRILAEEIIKKHFGSKVVFDDIIIDYFWKTLELCDKYNIGVLLISYPVTEQYYRLALDYVKTSELDRIGDKLKIKYPSVKLINYRNLYFNRLEYFKDADHLNKTGARDFSLLVKKVLESR